MKLKSGGNYRTAGHELREGHEYTDNNGNYQPGYERELVMFEDTISLSLVDGVDLAATPTPSENLSAVAVFA